MNDACVGTDDDLSWVEKGTNDRYIKAGSL